MRFAKVDACCLSLSRSQAARSFPKQPRIDKIRTHFREIESAGPENNGSSIHGSGESGWLIAVGYIPGNFIPAILRAKLGLPICLNIFFICAYWRSRLFTSCTLVPEPREMRLRRLPLITS